MKIFGLLYYNRNKTLKILKMSLAKRLGASVDMVQRVNKEEENVNTKKRKLKRMNTM
jgi:ribosomal protein L13E